MYQKILSINNNDIKKIVEERKKKLESANCEETLPAYYKGFIPSKTK